VLAARGELLHPQTARRPLKKDEENVGIPTFAITGGTKAYKNARGQITEKKEQDKELRHLDIVL
jgi:hypothetical protein